jgi:purine-binding chemotaxis protein CheW
MEQNANLEAKQYVVFKLGKEEYGIDIQKVTTIEKVMTIARVPKTPVYIKGVINLRGEIIPIIDLRTRFKLPEAEATEDTRIIIIKIEEISVGFIVDAVDEVMQLTEDAVENVSSFSNDLSMDYILGVGKINDRIVTLLNLEILIKMSENG